MLKLGIMIDRLIKALQGRTTAFCVAFFAAGNVLHFLHRLDATYITFMATLMGFVAGHSLKESYFEAKQPAAERKDDKACSTQS